jgi:signal transduction histidine kinase
MQELVQRILVEIQSSAPQRPIEQSVQGNPSGVWDGERLCQVMTNLLGNAVRHGAQDEPIHVRLDGRGADTVIVEVANGGTIAPDLLPHLFDPFRGREPSAGRQQGLGLGLFIAQQIVLAHGGNIDVRSQDGATCFRVQLPRVARADRSQGTARLPL